MNWNDYFMNLAHAVSLKSRDSTQVGCVIVGEDKQILSTGYNGFARGVDDSISERYERPEKYDWTIHAECNAIAHAARHGVRLKGSTAYVTHFCCSGCADMIIQAGVIKVVCGGGKTNGDFKKQISMKKLLESGVEIEYQ